MNSDPILSFRTSAKRYSITKPLEVNIFNGDRQQEDAGIDIENQILNQSTMITETREAVDSSEHA